MFGNVCVVLLAFLCFVDFRHQRRRKYNRREQTVEHPEVISEQQSSTVEEKYKTNRLTEEECKNFIKLVAYVEKEKHISIPI